MIYMLFSVVVPVYGVEKFLSQCIESILTQSYSDFELILVDDGSIDNSGIICDVYSANDIRIKVIHKNNGGLVSARKVGVNEAKGDYIVPVDGDDWIDSKLLERLAYIIQSYPQIEVICYGQYQGHSMTEYTKKSIDYKEGFYDKDKIHDIFFPTLIKGKDGKRFPPNICGKALVRRQYQKYQNAIPDTISLGEDAAVVYPLISHTRSMYILKDCYYYYRMNPNSMTRGRSKGFNWNDLRVLAKVWEDNLNPNYDFQPQINRYMCHDLFNVAKSHLQTNQDFSRIRKSIIDELTKTDFRSYVTHADFDMLSLEQIPRILLKYQLIHIIKFISRYI